MAGSPSADVIELPTADFTLRALTLHFPQMSKKLSISSTDPECSIARPECHVGACPGNQ